MKVTDTAGQAAKELAKALEQIDEAQVEALMDAICGAKKIYVAGAGRSMLMLRGLAMRLMHLGFESYVVGETTTPAFEKEDLLICGSGSGETAGVINVASKAKKIGGKIAALTINKDSTLGQMADVIVEIPAYTDKVECKIKKKPILPGGTMFEQCILLIGDTFILPLAEKAGIPTDCAFTRHANLE